MRWMLFPTLLLIGVSIGGCVTDACGAWKPIMPSRDDTLTRGTKQQIVANNEARAEICGAR